MTATLTDPSHITVTWNAVTGAASYIVQRSYNNSAYVTVGTAATTSYIDGDSQIASGGIVTYVYQVLTVSGSTQSLASGRDIATHITFTNDPAVSNTTLIRGVLVDEARQAVDAVRVSAGLPRLWNGAASVTGSYLYASIFQDLFNGLNPARTSLGLAALSYGGAPAPAIGGSILVQHLDTVRAGVK